MTQKPDSGRTAGDRVITDRLEGRFVTGYRIQKLFVIICSKCKTGNGFCTCIPTYSWHVAPAQLCFFFQ